MQESIPAADLEVKSRVEIGVIGIIGVQSVGIII